MGKSALQAEEKQLITDKASGKIGAESKDSAKIAQDVRNVKGEKKEIAADKANLKAEQ